MLRSVAMACWVLNAFLLICASVAKPIVFYTDLSNTSTEEVNLVTKLSTEAERSLFKETCDTKSALYFPWVAKQLIDQGTLEAVCNSSSTESWMNWARKHKPHLAALLEAGKVYHAEWAALFARSSWYMADSVGPVLYEAFKHGTEQLKPLPSNYRIPLTLVSSSLTRQRTMSTADLKALYTDGDGPSPPPQECLDNRSEATRAVTEGSFNNSMLVYRGASVGTLAHRLDYCNDDYHPAGYSWNDASLSSTTLDISRAVDNYARENGTLSLWLLDNYGYYDWSGETEFLPAVGVELRQIACDILPPGFVPEGSVIKTPIRHVSFVYETTTRGILPADQEATLLQKMRKAIYGDRNHMHQSLVYV